MKYLIVFFILFLSMKLVAQDDINKLDEIVIKTSVNLDSFLDSLFQLNNGKNQIIKYSNHKTVKFLNQVKIDQDTLLYLNGNFKFFPNEMVFKTDIEDELTILNFYIHETKNFGENIFVFKKNNKKIILPLDIFKRNYSTSPLTLLLFYIEKERKKMQFFKENVNDNDYKLYFKITSETSLNIEGYLIVDKINYVIKDAAFRLNNNLKSLLKVKHQEIVSNFQIIDYYGTINLSKCFNDKYCIDNATTYSKLKLEDKKDQYIIEYLYSTKKSSVNNDEQLVHKFEFKNYNKQN